MRSLCVGVPRYFTVSAGHCAPRSVGAPRALCSYSAPLFELLWPRLRGYQWCECMYGSATLDSLLAYVIVIANALEDKRWVS